MSESNSRVAFNKSSRPYLRETKKEKISDSSGSIVVLSHVEAFGLGKVPFARSKNYLAESNFEADSGEWGTRD
ncbi:hypothetical protein HZH66_011083 [Vespula vulgaris]|uniref:Uncharacterized protein n=1 Tax=Vespula vulgaris TaxID=7454 RepID=A0A834JDT3_VESVU|nr:hypothetical protein HZH66_011083 [Vespula vulgaris]